MAKPPQSRFTAPLCDTLYLQSLLDVIVSHMVSWRVAACPSAHLHFCHRFQLLHVGASDWHCLHPVQHSWLKDHCVSSPSRVVVLSCRIGRLTSSSSCSIRTESSCFVYLCAHATIALQGASQIKFGDLWQLGRFAHLMTMGPKTCRFDDVQYTVTDYKLVQTSSASKYMHASASTACFYFGPERSRNPVECHRLSETKP